MSEGNTPNFVSHYVDAINTGESLRLPANGTPKRDLLHVEDFAQACDAFIDSVIRHGLYNLGGGAENTLSLRELITKMEEISGLQAVIEEENPSPAPVPINYVSDLTLIKQELDWKPEISLDEGLQRLFKTIN
jgi:nucleoside-diphosphate-sugar epimerase